MSSFQWTYQRPERYQRPIISAKSTRIDRPRVSGTMEDCIRGEAQGDPRETRDLPSLDRCGIHKTSMPELPYVDIFAKPEGWKRMRNPLPPCHPEYDLPSACRYTRPVVNQYLWVWVCVCVKCRHSSPSGPVHRCAGCMGARESHNRADLVLQALFTQPESSR